MRLSYYIHYFKMKTNNIMLMLISVLMCSSIVRSYSQSSIVKPANTTTLIINKTNIADKDLVLEIAIPTNIPAQSTSKIEGKIINSGSHPARIYMPGLSLFPKIIFDPKLTGGMRPDELGIPIEYVRVKSPVDDLNYVLLEPGDCYSRLFACKTMAREGMQLSFILTYETPTIKRKLLWVGKASLRSDTIPVVKKTNNE